MKVMQETTSASRHPSVAVVVVNWNGLADTRACLSSLSAVSYPDFSVVVVDNGSRTDEAGALRAEFGAGPLAVEVVAAGCNLGFTGGNNLGIGRALAGGAEYVLCLNNDTVVAPDFLTHLVQALEEDPQAGIATGAIYYHGEPERIWALGIRLCLNQVPPTSHFESVADLSLDPNGVAEVPAVSGCVLLMRRALAEATSGFDGHYFAYVEDVDLCLRARTLGWHCIIVLESKVWHKVGSATGGEYSPAATHYFTRNCYRLVRRHGTTEERRAFLAAQRRRWSDLFRAFVRDCWLAPGAWEDARRRGELLEAGTNIFCGLLGLSGDRQTYRRREALIRQAVELWVRLVVGWCRYLYVPVAHFCLPGLRLYGRLYWKVYSRRPAAVRLLSRPINEADLGVLESLAHWEGDPAAKKGSCP